MSGSVGLGGLLSDSGNVEVEADAGPALDLTFGKEWWVGRNWGSASLPHSVCIQPQRRTLTKTGPVPVLRFGYGHHELSLPWDPSGAKP